MPFKPLEKATLTVHVARVSDINGWGTEVNGEIHRVNEVKLEFTRAQLANAFALLLRTYALFTDRPPFTADQLEALTAGDEFSGVDIEKTFGVRPTPFREAIRETFLDPVYGKVRVASYV